MVLITLISEAIAKEKNKFYYMGPSTDCKECKLRNVCFNLEPGCQYEVVSLRDTVHDCIVNEDKVRVAEVVKIVTTGVVGKKLAIEGSVITFQAPVCDNIGCDNYRICHPTGIENGRKCQIENLGPDVDCPIGEKLVSANLV